MNELLQRSCVLWLYEWKCFSHDQFWFNGYRAIIRANVIDEELRNKGSEGNERGISEIKMQIMLASRQ